MVGSPESQTSWLLVGMGEIPELWAGPCGHAGEWEESVPGAAWQGGRK